jgi:hypothetical protein
MTRRSFSKFASLIGSGAILMPEGVSSGRLRAETPSGDAEALRTLKTVMRWTSIIMETSGPGVDEVRMLLSWLGDCKISKADHDGSFHDTYSNACAFASSTFMTLRSRFGYQFGIDRQPWAFALGHQSKASELNNLEMEALIAMFQSQGSGEYVPYPDSPRMEPTSTHQEPFNRFLASQGAKSGDTKLVYARWFLGSQQRSKPQPYLAFGYKQKNGNNPQMTVGLLAVDTGRGGR